VFLNTYPGHIQKWKLEGMALGDLDEMARDLGASLPSTAHSEPLYCDRERPCITSAISGDGTTKTEREALLRNKAHITKPNRRIAI
jgi:hypothetical protein